MESTTPLKHALLICDIQNRILQSQNKPSEEVEAYIAKLNEIIATARKHNILLVFIRVAFRSGHPEINPINKLFSGIKKAGILVDGTEDAAFCPKLDFREGDLTVTKTRFGAFSTTNLRTILTSNGVNSIILAGVATTGVIMSTVDEASDMDFKITVLGDACLDANDLAHNALVEHILPKRSDVMTWQEWITSLN